MEEERVGDERAMISIKGEQYVVGTHQQDCEATEGFRHKQDLPYWRHHQNSSTASCTALHTIASLAGHFCQGPDVS